MGVWDCTHYGKTMFSSVNFRIHEFTLYVLSVCNAHFSPNGVHTFRGNLQFWPKFDVFTKSEILVILCKKWLYKNYVKDTNILFSSVNFYVYEYTFIVFRMWRTSFSVKCWFTHFFQIFDFPRKSSFCKMCSFRYFWKIVITIICTHCVSTNVSSVNFNVPQYVAFRL